MNKRIPIALGILLTFFALWLMAAPSHQMQQLLERLDSLGYDLALRTRILTHQINPRTPVAIIDIDDKSLREEGRWPWSRNKLAQLVTALKQQGVAVIAFDMFFAEPEHNLAEVVLTQLRDKQLLNETISTVLSKNLHYFNQDEQLAQSLTNEPVILAFSFLPRMETQNELPAPALLLSPFEKNRLNLFQARGFISNIPILQKTAKGAGFLNIFPDSDGIIRRAALIMSYQGKVYPSLALQAVMTFLDEKIQLVAPFYNNSIQLEGIKLGPYIIPTDAKGQVLIPFIGRSYTFPFYSATDVLRGNIAPNALSGKIVFVGTSATASGDLKPTAIQNPFPGVEIQATLVNGLLLNDFSYKPAWTFGAQLVITFLFGLLASILFVYLGPRMLSLIIIIFPPTLFFINNWIWQETGLVLSVLVPVLLVLIIAVFNIIYGYLFETRRRERLKEMFGQYVPEKHIEEMLKAKSSLALQGEDRYMSVLFADIRNFTHISEGMPATELVEMLNTFFTPMTEVIFNHRGTIDKYVGDLIMAFWGAPLKDKHHARHAIESALAMRHEMAKMQRVLAARHWPPIKIGIGINSGIMSVGDMGSRYRRNYTVLGDAVNLASRVETLTKYYGVDIIVTSETEKNQSNFVFRKLDVVRVKGKGQGVGIYEVVCHKSVFTQAVTDELSMYHAAQEDYFQQNWQNALKHFRELNRLFPTTKLYKIYLERIKYFQMNPPRDWDGVYIHPEK